MGKNKLDEVCEDKILTIQEQIHYLAEIWKILGIKGTPTEEDIINPSTRELETILMMKKFLGSENRNNR